MAVVLNISTPTSKFWYPLLILSDFLNANKIHFPCVNNFPRELKKISKKKKWNIFHSMQMFQRERERDSLLLLFNRDRSPPLLLRLVASVVVVHRPPKSFLIYLFTMADKYGLSLSLYRVRDYKYKKEGRKKEIVSWNLFITVVVNYYSSYLI